MSATEAERRRLGANIRRIMRERGMTQRQLAEAVGVPEGTISRIVNVYNEPRVGTLMRICEALECGVNDLLEGVVE